MLTAMRSMYLILETHGGRRQLQQTRQSVPNHGLNQTAALRLGKKDRLKMTGERESTGLCNQLDMEELKGQRDFRDGR